MLGNLENVFAYVKDRTCAIGAFNVTESTMFKAVVEVAEELRAPVIVQVSPNEVDFCDIVTGIATLPSGFGIALCPFVLHYDHREKLRGMYGGDSSRLHVCHV